MTSFGLPADVIGHMAGLGGTDEELDPCPSCQRALIYGALAHISAADAAMDNLQLDDVAEYLANATQILLHFAKFDLRAALGGEDLSSEEWEIALHAFLGARMEHFVNLDNGDIIFEHDDDGDGNGLAEVAG